VVTLAKPAGETPELQKCSDLIERTEIYYLEQELKWLL